MTNPYVSICNALSRSFYSPFSSVSFPYFPYFSLFSFSPFSSSFFSFWFPWLRRLSRSLTMHSHHSHSGQFCAHAKSTLDQVLHEAYAQGFTTYGLSEHVPRSRECDLYLEEREAGLGPVELHRRFESYLSEARKAQTEWEGRMHLLVGCETENTHSPGSMDELIALLDRGGRAVDSDDSFRSDRRAAEEVGRGKVDYIVGSVHHAHEIPIDFDKPTFERALAVCGGEPSTTPEGEEDAHRALMRSYLDLQYEVMQRLRPEVIGHFDLCRLFRPAGRFRRADAAKQDAQEDEVWTRVVRNVRYAAKYGALFEVNAAAFRKGWDEAYPGREVLDVSVPHLYTIATHPQQPDQPALNIFAHFVGNS